MKIFLRRYCVILALLPTLILTSCTSLRRPIVTATPSRLSPANDIFDIEKFGLKRLWRHDLGLVSKNPLVNIYAAGGKLVVEAGDAEVHVFDAVTGLWQTMTVLKGQLRRAPTVAGDELLLMVSDRIYPFDMAAGETDRWYRTPFDLWTPPQVYADSYILSGGNGHVARVRIEGKRELWDTPLRGPIEEQPVIVNDRLYVAAYHDSVAALQLSDGERLWSWTPPAPAKLTSGAAVFEAEGQQRVCAGDSRGTIYVLDATHGSLVWKKMADAPIVGKAQSVDGKLLVLSSKPELICLDPGEGRQELWRQAGVERIVVAGAEVIYVLSEDGQLAALAMDTGEELWREPLPGNCKVAGDPDKPVFYVANPKGAIVAFGELD